MTTRSVVYSLVVSLFAGVGDRITAPWFFVSHVYVIRQVRVLVDAQVDDLSYDRTKHDGE